ncbi:NADP oxidoreductase [Reticulibacter mediterranei]|uniref:NADP oxidoreductase n=1 Tax=Reticulibacter mediterranei TaxID=2778369 RepID=A0A8J3IWT3_9CHLR|nr:Ni/Fe hydrogenase subunit alpha [Reticulibacter mediterranei]GHO99950.1 NADP oxidoreductase [Reticulibacter mediterranei]
MSQRITIDPVTRIEGHAKITLQLDEKGSVEDAHFHVTQVRGFEKFCEGRPFTEMPSLMARICGICPVSHLIASSKACDALLAVHIPPTAVTLRRIMNLAQIMQSHALSFFYLSAPDLLLGMDADPAQRNLFGILAQHPQMARDGIRLRSIGQQIIELLGGKRIHPAWVVPGGVSEPLSAEKRDQMVAMLPEAREITLRTLEWFKGALSQYREEIASFANFPSLFMGLVNDAKTMEHYDGTWRIVTSDGRVVADQLDPLQYQTFIEEKVENWTYLKSPYYRPLGEQAGMYRVGPLARLLVSERCGTPQADRERAEFLETYGEARTSSFFYHYARLIEILYASERMEELLNEPDILNPRVRAHAEPNQLEGIGVAEAPRGTLIHHYTIDEHGLIRSANLIIATGHNNLAMNRGVLQVAQHFIKDAHITDGMLNRMEAVIRAFDPCLSCSTHALGEMPLHVQVFNADGAIVDERIR